MTKLELLHTSALDAPTLIAARSLLDGAFDGLDEHDWNHALGGMHALVWEDDGLIGHASVVQRSLLHGGRALRAGYVEAVAVRGDRRSSGHATTMMNALETIIRDAYDLGALSASEAAGDFYAHRNWHRWKGRLHALTPQGTVRTEDDEGSVHVLPAGAPLDLTADLVADFRDGDLW
ncbi:aminoglycoside N-acetyltransferase AAC(2')-Ic [Actinocorallia longicatena]|uniref:Aminoglycoside N-acetyltransferase AAC(2')-Ic n=2 Tax=Actinocorallia longicatena TaxID=111803 RepID=A0ABP6Q899_9ACTN